MSVLHSQPTPRLTSQKYSYELRFKTILLENVKHCGGEPEQAANMHMNTLSFTLKWWAESECLCVSFMHNPYLKPAVGIIWYGRGEACRWWSVLSCCDKQEVRRCASLNSSRLRYGCQRCTLAVAQQCHAACKCMRSRTFNFWEIFKRAFKIYGIWPQAQSVGRSYTHTSAQCSLASVGFVQARHNNKVWCSTVWAPHDCNELVLIRKYSNVHLMEFKRCRRGSLASSRADGHPTQKRCSSSTCCVLHDLHILSSTGKPIYLLVSICSGAVPPLNHANRDLWDFTLTFCTYSVFPHSVLSQTNRASWYSCWH